MTPFRALGLSAPLVEAVEAMGFQQPTNIQQLVVPQLLEKPTDLIALAQTGTGKTAAFGLPLIQLIDASANRVQALVLAPTRELALQITSEIQRFSVNIPRFRVVTVYGGADIKGQIRELQTGAHLVVATPGRLKDLMSRRRVDISEVRYIVLDEADEMLNMGFRPDIDHILSESPAEKNTWLFSATMSAEVQSLVGLYLNAPLEASAGGRNSGNEDIEHQYILLKRSEKYDTMRRLLDFHAGFYGLLFCRTRQETKDIVDQLNADGYAAEALHGDLSQSQREQALNRFRRRHSRVLVATDVAARGLDIDDLTHVIHLNIPDDLDFYTHRSGRTGRAGKQGISLALLTKADMTALRQIEKRSKVRFSQVYPPTAGEIYRNRLLDKFQEIRNTTVREEVKPLLSGLVEEMKDLSREEIIARVASWSIAHIKPRHEEETGAPGSDKGRGEAGRAKGVRLFINIGRMDDLDKASFLRLICEHTGIPGAAIGKILMQPTFTYFEVEEPLVPGVLKEFRDAYLDGRRIRVNPADSVAPGKKQKDNKKAKKSRKPALAG